MRPISKTQPLKANGSKVKFASYGDAKPILVSQTGRYCHFCEMPILNSPAVEHIKPKECEGNKTKYANLKNEWSNLLLICTYCNSTKGNQDIKLQNYYWPFKHNTILAFEHLSGTLLPHSSLNPLQTTKSNNTIGLYGLHKTTDSTGGKDTRFEFRLRAISQALERLIEYESTPPKVTINAIIGQAKDAGFWSVWYNIFINHQLVMRTLITEFKAAATCFDATAIAIPRNPANPVDTI